MAKILIVDDNDLNTKLLSDVLEYHGYSIETSGNGADALLIARQQRPGVILLDMQLPDISGMEVCRRLKRDHQTSHIPIIAVTAFAMPGDRGKILAGGCDEYISKPFKLGDLLSLVLRHAPAADDHQATPVAGLGRVGFG